jgi:radical SAM protein with 4Fe4S-binding SPASM domain
MSARFAVLNREWMLRGWADTPLLLANWKTGDQRELKKAGFYVAESCNGRMDFDSLAFLPRHRALLDRLIEEGIADECREGASIETWQVYRKAQNPRLAGIHWCVTGFCNLNCRHCYMEAPSGRYGELPLHEMARLIEQFERANVIEVSLTGGEPFLRKDLLEILRMLAGKKIHLSQIYTNGLLVTDEHLRDISAIGYQPAFQVSFDGVGAHDRMRGVAGVEEGVVAAIRRLRGAGFPVTVATSIDSCNLGSLAGTYELMKTLDIQSWRVSSPQETGNWRGATTAASLDEQAGACLPLLQRWLGDGKPFAIQLGGFFRGGPVRERPSGSRPHRASPKRGARSGRSRVRPGTSVPNPVPGVPEAPAYTPDAYDCGACREQPNLLPDGTLVPCPGYVDSVLQDRMPNLLREELSAVWTGSFLRQIADMRKRDLLEAIPECAACDLFGECGTGCRAFALTATGSLMAKDPAACEMCQKGYKRRFREAAAHQESGFG